MNNKTTIAIRKDVRNQLASLGDKGSTYDEIIQKLLSKWNEKC